MLLLLYVVECSHSCNLMGLLVCIVTGGTRWYTATKVPNCFAASQHHQWFLLRLRPVINPSAAKQRLERVTWQRKGMLMRHA